MDNDRMEMIGTVLGIVILILLIFGVLFGGYKAVKFVGSFISSEKTVEHVVENKNVPVEEKESKQVSSHPNTWSELLKSMPNEMNDKQKELKQAMSRIK